MSQLKSFSASIALHALLVTGFIGFGLSMQHAAGVQSAKTITTYFYNKRTEAIKPKHPIQKELTQHGALTSKLKTSPKKTESPMPYKNTKGYNALLSKLHNLIQQQQIYPASALFANQTGSATIAFQLNSQGNVTAVRLEKSSGTPSLDAAAMNAVNAISPVEDVKLKQSEEFNVAVDFQERR